MPQTIQTRSNQQRTRQLPSTALPSVSGKPVRDSPVTKGLQLNLLGRFRLALDEQELRLPAGKAVLVLAFLACARDRTARRDRLASLFWQDADVEQARGSLRQTLSRLRSTLGCARDAVWSDNDQIGLIQQNWSIDTDALAGCDGQDPDLVDPDWAATFLSGVHRRDPSIDAWLEGERQRFQQTVSRVFLNAIEHALKAGDASRAVVLGGRLIALDPFAERAHRNLMLAHEMTGDRPGALRRYRTLVRILDEGLGVAPDADSHALYERLRQTAVARSDSPSGSQRERSAAGSSAASQRELSAHSDCSKAAAMAQSQRLVAVLSIRHDEITLAREGKDKSDTIARQRGGESILSHGAESLFVFGLDGTGTGGAEAAFRAALQIRESSRAGQVPACGCASGLVRIDSDVYPVGSVVQRAARLALLADSGDLIIDRAMHSQIPARLETETVTLRNQLSFRVRAVQFHAPAHGHALYGRRVELQQLIRMLSDTTERGAAIVLLSGEAGMGKTHLMLSLELAARGQSSSVLRLGFSTHAVTPMSLVERLVRLLHDELTEQGADTVFDELEQAVLTSLLNPQHDAGRHAAPADEGRHRIDLIVTMMARLSSSAPLLLIAEDCHWADNADIEQLIELIDRQSSQPILMVATERRENETIAPVMQSRVVDVEVLSLTLTPLSRQDASALVRSLVDDTDRQHRILDRAGGHPLFLVQLAEMEVDPDAPVPVSVVALVQSALDQIDTNARDACLKTAVLGAHVTLSVLESLFPEIDRTDLAHNRLLQWQGEHLSFRHALIHEAVYALLSPDERARLHALAARHFQNVNAAEYAHHALCCGDPLMAAEACADAADWLLTENRHADAERLVDRVLPLASQADTQADTQARLRLSKALVLRESGKLNEAIAMCRGAFDRACEAGLQVRALIHIATLLKRRTEFDRAAAQLRQASQIAEARLVADHYLAELEHEWGNIMFMQGQANACRQHHLRARNHAERAGDRRLQAAALGGLADACYAEGKARSARHHYTECVNLAERANLALIAIAHRPMAGFTGWMIEPGPEVIDELREGVDKARRWKNVHYEMLARLAIAEPLLYACRFDEAAQEIRCMEDLQSRHGGERFAPDLIHLNALSEWARGSLKSAGALALEGVRLHGNSTYLGPTLQSLQAALCDDQANAEQALIAAEAQIRQGSVVHNRINLAVFGSACHWRHGNPEQARRLLETMQRGFGTEPIGILDACLRWLQPTAAGERWPAEAAMSELDRRSLGLLATTHPRSA